MAGGGSGRPLCITQCQKKLRPLQCCYAAYAGLYEEASSERNKRPYFQGTTCDYLRRAGVDNLIGQKKFAPLRICCPVLLHILYFSAVISGYRAIYRGGRVTFTVIIWGTLSVLAGNKRLTGGIRHCCSLICRTQADI